MLGQLWWAYQLAAPVLSPAQIFWRRKTALAVPRWGRAAHLCMLSASFGEVPRIAAQPPPDWHPPHLPPSQLVLQPVKQ